MSRDRLYDPYGQLSVMLGALNTYSILSRGTGRTETMINAACETGGTIVVTEKIYNWVFPFVKKKTAYQKLRVEVIAPDPREKRDIHRYIRHGPIYFDHAWLEEYYRNVIAENSDFLFDIFQHFPSPQRIQVHPQMKYLIDPLSKFRDDP